jgi:hypothetical protein
VYLAFGFDVVMKKDEWLFNAAFGPQMCVFLTNLMDKKTTQVEITTFLKEGDKWRSEEPGETRLENIRLFKHKVPRTVLTPPAVTFPLAPGERLPVYMRKFHIPVMLGVRFLESGDEAKTDTSRQYFDLCIRLVSEGEPLVSPDSLIVVPLQNHKDKKPRDRRRMKIADDEMSEGEGGA